MFWDRVSRFYDLAETVYNGKVIRGFCTQVAEMIAPADEVLECACGTGFLSRPMAERCRRLVATDCSAGMLRQARRKCRGLANVRFEEARLPRLRYAAGVFDKVVAGNVIHLLDQPEEALEELLRVCKRGGQVILPTYLNAGRRSLAVALLEKTGAGFRRQFTYESYQAFFHQAGYPTAVFWLVEGRMPCAIAVITK